MKNRNLSIIVLLMLTVSLVTFSCKKDKEEEKIDNETTSAQDNALSQNMFDDIKKVVEEAAKDEGNTNKAGFFFGTCATVSISPNWIDSAQYWPKTMTIDFGTTNCTGTDGVNRRGVISVTLTDRYVNAGSVLTVQPQNYYINDHLIEGTKTITNNGRNSSGNLSFTVQVTNGKVTFPAGGYTTWSSTRTNEWVAGESTPGLLGLCDDVYLITGSATGVNRVGKSYSVNITSPLRKEICCRWLVSGTVDIVPSGLLTRTVNFGGGNCDNIATVTIAGNTFTFAMN
ncbi:MAG: hypothetical protein H6589_09740 [Flavobacteriales bacterium]|nr:hypothetical protein [Flavobacteriales bacterium]